VARLLERGLDLFARDLLDGTRSTHLAQEQPGKKERRCAGVASKSRPWDWPVGPKRKARSSSGAVEQPALRLESLASVLASAMALARARRLPRLVEPAPNWRKGSGWRSPSARLRSTMHAGGNEFPARLVMA
jgi:hypothetical protein